jgi:hypothetical protein
VKNLRANLFVTPISLLVGGIATAIFAITKLPWSFYLLGLVGGILTQGLFIKMNNRIARNMEIDPEAKIYNPRKDMAIGSIVRTLVIIVVFISAIAKADVKNNENAMLDILFTVFGYTTYRIIFIACLLIFRDKEDEIK